MDHGDYITDIESIRARDDVLASALASQLDSTLEISSLLGSSTYQKDLQLIRVRASHDSKLGPDAVAIPTYFDASIGQRIVLMEDIEQVFKDAVYITSNEGTVPLLEDKDGHVLMPKRILHKPGVVLEVVMESAPVGTSSPSVTSVNSYDFLDKFLGNHSIDQDSNVHQSVSDCYRLYGSQLEAIMSGQARQAANIRDNLTEIFASWDSEALKQENLLGQMQRLRQAIQESQRLDGTQIHPEILSEMQQQVLQAQQESIDRLVIMRSHILSVLNRTFEMHEYPLFIVLPMVGSQEDGQRRQFRLHFLCEYTASAESSSIGLSHELHLAKHQGYNLRQLDQFLKTYGTYVLSTLGVMKSQSRRLGKSAPSPGQTELTGGLNEPHAGQDPITSYIDTLVDEAINFIEEYQEETSRKFDNASGDETEAETFDFSHSADMRQLERQLYIPSSDRALGDLYRTFDNDGYSKWVCKDHYYENIMTPTPIESHFSLTSNTSTFSSGRTSVLEMRDLVPDTTVLQASGQPPNQLQQQPAQIYPTLTDGQTSMKGADAMTSMAPAGALSIPRRHSGAESADTLLHTTKKRVDNSWRQWVDTPLAKNQGLAVLDLSNTPVNHATIAVLNSFVSTHGELMTLALTRCQLDWTSVVPLFKTLCAVNKNTKFTLDVSQNPLFDSEASLLGWIQVLAEDGRRVDGTPFSIKMQDLIIRDAALRRVLEPLEEATCLNEFNIKGMLIKRESQAAELEGLTYGEANARIRPEDASDETCLGLGRVLSRNKTLVTMNISGTEIKQQVQEQTDSSTAPANALKNVVAIGRSTGGFGRQVSLAFLALAENDTLRALSVDHNRFGEDGMVLLAEALKSNTGIGSLSCDGNDAYTHKALKAIEKILPPFELTPTLVPSPSSVASTQTRTFQGTMEEAQAAGYNSTLSLWILKSDEILMHHNLLSMEVKRLLTDLRRIEKLQTRKFGGERSIFGAFIETMLSTNVHPIKGRDFEHEGKFNATLFSDEKERFELAARNREDYFHTFSRIVGAIKENNRRTREAYERKEMMEQQASSL